jgi:hypothetical protein
MTISLAQVFGFHIARALLSPRRLFRDGTQQKRVRVGGAAKPAGNKLARMAAEARLTPFASPGKEPAKRATSRSKRRIMRANEYKTGVRQLKEKFA